MAAWEATYRETISRGVDDRAARSDRCTAGKSTMQLDDGSIVGGRLRADQAHDRVRRADVKPPKITAVRLELLNDPNLPHGGPGRSIDGTCALTEMEVDAAPLNKPAEAQEVKIARRRPT